MKQKRFKKIVKDDKSLLCGVSFSTVIYLILLIIILKKDIDENISKMGVRIIFLFLGVLFFLGFKIISKIFEEYFKSRKVYWEETK